MEIIYIDNNSTDNTRNILLQLSEQDPRITILSESKKGAGAARNRGLAEARGDIISFLDVDD